MGQTGVIFFGLLVGFVVFITIRGELTGYLQVIGIAPGGTVGSSAPTTASGQVPGTGTGVGPGGGLTPVCSPDGRCSVIVR